MICPVCGNRILGVYHEWNGKENTALFEYLHAPEEEIELPSCTLMLNYDEGQERYKREWLEMYPTEKVH